MVYLTSFIRTFQFKKYTKQCRFLALKPLMMGSSSSSTITEVCTVLDEYVLYCTVRVCTVLYEYVLYCTVRVCTVYSSKRKQTASVSCKGKLNFYSKKLQKNSLLLWILLHLMIFWNLREKIFFRNGNL